MSARIALIPARGGSKRIAHKNIVDFCGKPLMAYSVETARTCGLFDEVHVSTNDPSIATVAAEAGAPVAFMRPDELADDHTPLAPVMRWVLQEYAHRGKTFDSVCLLMACAPLIESEDLVGAYDLFRDNGADMPVISVVAYGAPVEWAYGLDDKGVLVPRQPGMFAHRSQDLQKTYYDSGAFAFFPCRHVQDEGFAGGGEMLPYILPPQRSVDIDEPEDLEFAKIIYRGLHASTRNND